MLRREKIELSIERRVISNLIMSTPLIAFCKSAGDPSLFESSLGRIVATWCYDYYDHTSAAPGYAITDLYRQKVSELPTADADMVFAFLSTCSDEWAPDNVELSKAMALKYFQERSLVRLYEKLGRAIQGKDISRGYTEIAQFTKPDAHKSEGVSLFKDAGEIANAFDNTEEELFRMPGPLGAIMGPIIREDFIALVGPPKCGKTWWLMNFATVAALSGLKVLFISLEMSKVQMIRRFWQMLTGTTRYGEEVDWPTFTFDESGKARVVVGKHTPPMVDTRISSIEAMQSTFRKMSRRGQLELRNYSLGNLSINGLKSELKNLDVYENFIPDVICLDYADGMDHGPGAVERDRLNNTWKALRNVASEIKGAVITVSHSGRDTVGGEKDVKAKNVTDDIRKVNHVTKLGNINQTVEEKKMGIVRIDFDTLRDGAPVNDAVVCTSCLAIGRPYLEIEFLSQVDLGQEEAYAFDEEQPRRPTKRSQYRR